MNPIYEKVGELAKQAIIQTFIEGEKTHPNDDWQHVDIMEHFRHALDHLANWELEENDEPHLDHAITRLAMIKYLEANHEQVERQTYKR